MTTPKRSRWHLRHASPIDKAMGAQSYDRDKEHARSEAIVRRIHAGDASAETELYEHYEKGLRYLLRLWCGDPDQAEDFLQETFGIAIKRLRAEPLKEPGKLAAYLRGTAHNLHRADVRKERRRATYANSDLIDRTADPHGDYDDVEAGELSVIVHRVLEAMPRERDREVLIRVYVYEEERSRVCRDLGLTPEHFNRVIHRARDRFRVLLSRIDQEEGLRVVESPKASAKSMDQ